MFTNAASQLLITHSIHRKRTSEVAFHASTDDARELTTRLTGICLLEMKHANLKRVCELYI
jgi:hypothetical protein